MSFQELATKAELPPRSIRFYIARGLVPGPRKAGRGATYGEEHIERIEEIRRWQAQGLTLAEIGRKLAGETRQSPIVAPTAWWRYDIQPDVIVQVRGDATPWRLKQIKNALQELAARFATATEEKEHDDNQ